MNLTPKNNLNYIAGELKGFREVLTFLWDGDVQAFNALKYIKDAYADWQDIFIWLKRNNLRGKKLVEFFENESPDGRGYLSGVEHIIARIEGKKHSIEQLKADRLK